MAAGKLSGRFDARRLQRRCGDFADAGNAAHTERREKCFFASGRHPQQAARLGLIAGHFRDQSGARQPRRARQARRRGNFAEQRVRRSHRRPVQPLGARQVQIRLVHRSHFHHRRIFSQDRRDAVAPLRIQVMPAVEKYRVRAEPRGRAQRHRRMYAVLSRFVAGRGNHAALVRLAANDHGLAAQFGTIQQLHRNKKRVHIHMQDRGYEGC